jgi:hypothetical protein
MAHPAADDDEPRLLEILKSRSSRAFQPRNRIAVSEGAWGTP